MAGIDNIDDREIERGRHHGSSSSRESSPERTQKRSFSPTSDDEGLVIPSTNDDDNAPAPPDRPLIRQPVGFSWNMSPSIATAGPINTYEASITVPAPTPYSTFFLPGQEVLSHPAFGGQSQNPEARESTTKTSGSRKKSKNGLPSQTGTGRFRLSAYDPTPAPGPSIQHGTGPYTSMFRGYTQNKPGGASAPSQQKPRKSRAKSTAKSTPVGVSKTAGHPESRALGSATSTNRTITTEPNALATPPRTPGYYRTDYEMHQTSSLDHAPPPSRTMVEYAALEPHAQAPFASHSTPHVDMINQGQSHQIETVEGGVKRVLRQLRMVTILMQDIRSGMTDHQLAEVKIPLRSADDPSEGFWADAKELCDKLQTSPSRIDGPARVYTLRGKYRQFFLRVSADNQDECISANIIISSERTLDVVIEDLPQVGRLPSPPRIPKDLLVEPAATSRSPTPLDVPRNGNSREPFKKRRREAGLGRREYDSDDDYDGHRSSSPSRSSNYSQSTYSRPTAANSPSASHLGPPAKKKQRSGIESAEDPAVQKKTLGTSRRNQPRGYDSPRSDDEPDEFQSKIDKAVDAALQADDDWERVFISMACSQRVADILEQYRLVQMMVDKWTNRRAAFDSFYYPMKKEDIIRAFKIEDPNYGSHCTETLALLSLYGSGGRRLENRKVIDLVNDKSSPTPNSKPIKQLLRLLREIDTEWKDKHPAGGV